MAQIYEGMFLLDNEVVREDWRRAKSVVTDVLEKNGGTVHTARRWDERKLAYGIKHRQRATYFLVYYEIPGDRIPVLIRDLDLSEPILRYLLTKAPVVPEGERELAEAERAPDFVVPSPPPDEVGSYEPIQEDASRDGSDSDEDGSDGEGAESTKRRRSSGEPVAAAVSASGGDDSDDDEPDAGKEA